MFLHVLLVVISWKNFQKMYFSKNQNEANHPHTLKKYEPDFQKLLMVVIPHSVTLLLQLLSRFSRVRLCATPETAVTLSLIGCYSRQVNFHSGLFYFLTKDGCIRPPPQSLMFYETITDIFLAHSVDTSEIPLNYF